MNFDTKKNLKNHKTWTIFVLLLLLYLYDTYTRNAKPFHDDYDGKKREKESVRVSKLKTNHTLK